MKKWTVVGLLGGVAFVTDLSRIAMGIVAPTLMELYDISPETMGFILSGWNWAYTGSLLMIGPIVDRFRPLAGCGYGGGILGHGDVGSASCFHRTDVLCDACSVWTGAQHADPRTGSLYLPLDGC